MDLTVRYGYRLNEQSISVGIGVLDDPKTDDSTNLYGNKPKRRCVVGAIQESPENERYKRTSTPINRGDVQAKPSPEGEGGKRADLGR